MLFTAAFRALGHSVAALKQLVALRSNSHSKPISFTGSLFVRGRLVVEQEVCWRCSSIGAALLVGPLATGFGSALGPFQLGPSGRMQSEVISLRSLWGGRCRIFGADAGWTNSVSELHNKNKTPMVISKGAHRHVLVDATRSSGRFPCTLSAGRPPRSRRALGRPRVASCGACACSAGRRVALRLGPGGVLLAGAH